MRGKLLFAAGLVGGYVLGARAGRPAYEAIAERVRSTAADPKVQKVVSKAKDAVEEKAPQVAAAAGLVSGTVAGAAEAAGSAPSSSDDGGDDDDDDAPAA
ncbi:YtxH domain-containing protein [uncultured Amnibacterium sp.]|uniref:YtxH domain-containing protein n=1 Tax=uncultured Amnibacterium sp. TaxID=1631851 RepID=UPI0035C9D55F